MSKKHGQLKQAITKMVQVVMGFLDDVPNMDTKLSLIDTLRTVTEGKVFTSDIKSVDTVEQWLISVFVIHRYSWKSNERESQGSYLISKRSKAISAPQRIFSANYRWRHLAQCHGEKRRNLFSNK